MRLPLRYLTACLASLLLVGCSPPSAPPAPSPVVDEHAGHDHAHPATGPNGGHLVELGDEEYHLEWTHDESGLVTLYVIDGAVQELVPITAEAITITAKVSESIDYELAAIGASGDPPASARFELKSPELLECLKLAGQGADVSVAVTISGKPYRGEFKHDDHGHGHHH